MRPVETEIKKKKKEEGTEKEMWERRKEESPSLCSGSYMGIGRGVFISIEVTQACVHKILSVISINRTLISCPFISISGTL